MIENSFELMETAVGKTILGVHVVRSNAFTDAFRLRFTDGSSLRISAGVYGGQALMEIIEEEDEPDTDSEVTR